MSMTLIEHIEVTGATAASIEFTSIPADYTDLKVLLSTRNAHSDVAAAMFISFNSSTASFTTRYLLGTGSGVSSSTGTTFAGVLNGATSTSNTFDNLEIYIPNYTSSNNKSFSVDAVTENNATGVRHGIWAGLWSNTSAIDTITITGEGNIVQYSSATLYGITAGSDGTTTVS